MGARDFRRTVIFVMAAVVFGSLVPTLASQTVESQTSLDLPQATSTARLASASLSPLAAIATVFDEMLFTPIIKAFTTSDLRDATGQSTPRPQDRDTASNRMPLFAGGAGGDEPAGPWP